MWNRGDALKYRPEQVDSSEGGARLLRWLARFRLEDVSAWRYMAASEERRHAVHDGTPSPGGVTAS